MSENKKTDKLNDDVLEKVAGGVIVDRFECLDMSSDQQKSFMTAFGLKKDGQLVIKAVKDAIKNCAQKDAVLKDENIMNQVVKEAMRTLDLPPTDVNVSSYLKQLIKDQLNGLDSFFKN